LHPADIGSEFKKYSMEEYSGEDASLMTLREMLYMQMNKNLALTRAQLLYPFSLRHLKFYASLSRVIS
jgi:hypothetical protein